MMILGIELNKLAEPATLVLAETEFETVFKMEYCGKAYQCTLSHFELLSMNSNEAIIKHITNIINEGKRRVGATCN